MLKTAVNAAASKDRIESGCRFWMMALKTFISWGTPTKRLKRWVVYHSMRMKLPNIDVSRKKAIDLNSDSDVRATRRR